MFLVVHGLAHLLFLCSELVVFSLVFCASFSFYEQVPIFNRGSFSVACAMLVKPSCSVAVVRFLVSDVGNRPALDSTLEKNLAT